MKAPMRVLLVDGHQGVRVGLSERLRRDPRVGAVVAVSTLDAALLAGHDVAPDVVLCDPTTIGGGATAPEVISRLRRLGWPLVVLMPSLGEGEHADLCCADGTTVLLKGCRFSALLAALEQAAAGRVPQMQPRPVWLSGCQALYGGVPNLMAHCNVR